MRPRATRSCSRAKGDESPDWEPGDVVLRVRRVGAEKGALRRKESSLYWKETIGVDEVTSYSKHNMYIYNLQLICPFFLFILPSLSTLPLFWGVDQALLGFTHNFTHLDGHVVSLVRKGVTQPGFVQTIKGEGMPLFERPTSHGDLFIEYNVVLPTKLSKETRQSTS